MRFQKTHMLGLALAVFSLCALDAAYADALSGSSNRATAEQTSRDAANSQASMSSEASSRDNDRKEDVLKDKDPQSEFSQNEQGNKNGKGLNDPRSIVADVMNNLQSYFQTMMSQWEYGADETVPQFMASDREINEALQKVLNRHATRPLKH